MSFRYGQKDRRDKNEKGIVAALKAVGAHVCAVSGKDCPDLVIWFDGKPFVCEVKSDRGKNRKDEAHDVPWPVVTTIGDALRLIGIAIGG